MRRFFIVGIIGIMAPVVLAAPRRERDPWDRPFDVEHISVGDIGRLDFPVKLFQIISKTEATISIDRRSSDDILFRVRGINTSNNADGQEIYLQMPLKVVGNVTFTNTYGAQRTVFVLEPFDATPLIEEKAKREAAAAKARFERRVKTLKAIETAIQPSSGPDGKPGWYKITLKNPGELFIEDIKFEICRQSKSECIVIKTMKNSGIPPRKTKTLTVKIAGDAPTLCRIILPQSPQDLPTSDDDTGVCDVCHGSKFTEIELPIKCTICNGDGLITKTRAVGDGMYQNEEKYDVKCTACKNGVRGYYTSKKKCDRCHGTGRIRP